MRESSIELHNGKAGRKSPGRPWRHVSVVDAGRCLAGS